ncbi:MAG: hypothetical protein JNK88_11815 [Mangrovicoccus sp.]|nr:hypothetical protein [Mangrovicoccus sp.]
MVDFPQHDHSGPRQATGRTPRPRVRLTLLNTGGGAIWWLLALATCLSVALINGGPLFYFDTEGYLLKGTRALTQLGLVEPGGAGGAAREGAAGAVRRFSAAGEIDGTHSIVYSLLIAGLAAFRTLELMVLVNAAVVFAALGLMLRVVTRLYPVTVPRPLLLALPILAAATTSLPFYVAFLMPDIFTPVLILIAALLTAFAPRMTGWELAAALLLGWFAALSHLSHIPIAALLIPAAAIGALLVGRRRWWLAPVLVASFVLVPMAERQLFEAMVATTSKAQVTVTYKPFITARLIQDGPGYRMLEQHCPDPALASCALWEALQLSDDPYRLTATHILFAEDPPLASFQTLPAETRQAIAAEQMTFFLRVLRDQPLGTMAAFLKNTLLQAKKVSVDMTLPSDAIVKRLERYNGKAMHLADFSAGRITAGDWLGRLTQLHLAIYGLSALVLIGLAVWPGRLPPALRVLAGMVICGVLANALVCGGISQPATRYGARAAWVLPLAATFLALIAAGLSPGTRSCPPPRKPAGT